MIDVLVFGLITLAWVFMSGKLSARSVTAPIVLAGAGLLLARLSPSNAVNLDSDNVRLLIELTLAVVLFSDASSVGVRWILDEWHYPVRLLGIGLPLTIALGAVTARIMFPDIDIWVLCVIAAALAPTDAALGLSIIEDERIPKTFRQVINVESGLNDGLATPVVTFFIATAVVSIEGSEHPVSGALGELVIAVLLGAGVGALAGRLINEAREHRWAQAQLLPIAPVITAVATYLLAVELGGNGFVAAFVCGVAVGATAGPRRDEDVFLFTEQIGMVLGFGVWFRVGLAHLAPTISLLTWPMVAYAVLSLTVLRMVPVAISSIGTHVGWDTIALAGWLGPRGLASIVFGMLAFEAIGGPDADFVISVVAITVAMSVVAHGLSAGPLATWYSRRHPVEGSTSTAATPVSGRDESAP